MLQEKIIAIIINVNHNKIENGRQFKIGTKTMRSDRNYQRCTGIVGTCTNKHVKFNGVHVYEQTDFPFTPSKQNPAINIFIHEPEFFLLEI